MVSKRPDISASGTHGRHLAFRVARLPGISGTAGQATVEFLVVAGIFCTALLSMPYLTKLFELKTATLEAARHAAWERAVWRNAKDDDTEKEAVVKTDDDLAKSIRHHFYSSKILRNEADETQYTNIAEWEDARSATRVLADQADVSVTTTDDAAPGWINNNIVSKIFDDFAAVYGTLTSKTGAGYHFDVDFKGLHNAEVSTKVSSDYVASLWKIVAPTQTPPTFTMAAHVSMVTGEWNGGGNFRTRDKVLGLVVTSFEDATVVKDLRKATKSFDEAIAKIFGGATKYTELGFDPTKLADESIPDDRKEQTDEAQDTNAEKKKSALYKFSPPMAYYVEYPLVPCLSAGVPDPASTICKLK